MTKVQATTYKKSPTLFSKGAFVGFTRSLANQKNVQGLLKLDGVKEPQASKHYHGKRVVYLYKVKNNKGSSIRSIWGKIIGSHGNSGLVRAKFAKNLPGQAIGRPIRVMLYPSTI